MYRLILVLLLFAITGTIQAQTVSRSGGRGLCGNYDVDDDCRLLNDDLHPGGTLYLEISSTQPDQAVISMRRLEDGQPLVEIAYRLSCGAQEVALDLPANTAGGTYLLEVRTRRLGFAMLVNVY